MDDKILVEKIENIEKELNSLDFRLKTVEANDNVALPDIQTGLVNLTITLGTLRDVLLENKITTPEKMQAISEKISKEISENYDKWMKEAKEGKKDNVQSSNNTVTN